MRLTRDNWLQLAWMVTILVAAYMITRSIDNATQQVTTEIHEKNAGGASDSIDKLTARLDQPLKIDFSSIGGDTLYTAADGERGECIYVTIDPKTPGALPVSEPLHLEFQER